MRIAGSVRLGTALLLSVWVGLVWVPPAAAQDDSVQQDTAQQDTTPPPGYIAAFEGTARLEREGEAFDVETGMTVVPGDRLRTEAGRVAIRLVDGGALHVDRYSEVDWPSDLVLRLGRGRVLVTLAGGATDRLSIEAPGALVRFDRDGRYRVAVGGEEVVSVELAVLEGSAEIVNDAGVTPLAAGQRARVDDGRMPSAAEYAAAAPTTLERWADEQLADTYASAPVSKQYLPNELDVYGSTFDRYGNWQTDVTYGRVWYPSVAVDWRPYSYGRWHHMRRYGWTWAAHDPWGWPTHHYGRWGLSARGAWFWIPSRTWGPAWVYWATTPTYVGWCPLGWNGRPVLNVFSYGSHYARGRDPWRAWSVVSRGSFGRPYDVRHRVGRSVLDRARPSFVMQHRQPGFAPPRRPATHRADRRGWDSSWGGAPTRRPDGRVPYDRSTPGDRARTDYGTRRPDGRVTDPGPSSQTSPYDRARPYTDRNGGAGARSPNGIDRPRRSDDDDNGRRPGYATPRRGPDGDGDRRGSSARPAPQNDRGAPSPRVAPPQSRPDSGRGSGRGHAAPRGGNDGGSRPAPSGGGRGRADGGGQRSGGDGGGRTAAPRRRP